LIFSPEAHAYVSMTHGLATTSRLTVSTIFSLPDHKPLKEVSMSATKEKKETKEEGSSAKGFRPLGDRVFVTYTEELERTAGGIYVPDSAREKPQRGTIEAAGADVENVKVGDQVLFDKYSGTKIKIENDDCLILKEEDILGVFVN
jgi:chaperonin GroES